MANTEPEKRESYAIDDDDVDVRLIQRQITNAIAQVSKPKTKHEKKQDSGEDAVPPQNQDEQNNQQQDNKTTKQQGAQTVIPPLLKSSTPRSSVAAQKSNADSLDVNEFVNMSNNEVSLDLLEQLTSKITAEMADSTPVRSEEPPIREENEEITEEEINELDEADESETNINSLEGNEELAEEETINQESEKTIVTEQICEYPANNFDNEYMQTLDYLEGDKRYKKFVIYIDEENIDFISSLSIQERKDIINSILREQDDIRIAKKEEIRRRKLIAHLLLGIITFVVCIPLLYTIVNKCLEATIENYKRSQYNFEVLYKERGKIQSSKSQDKY